MKILPTEKIVSIRPHYENLLIIDDKKKWYYMTMEELIKLFNEKDFNIIKKKVRTYLEVKE